MHSYLITFEQLLFSNPIHNVTMKYTLLLNQVGINDIPLVGGKNASLGEMLQNLTNLGVQVPDGFVLTVAAYVEYIKINNLDVEIKRIVNAIDYEYIE
jgi:pyruvate,water dikinase